MSNNLFVSYDLNLEGQNYESIIKEIKSLGNWAKVQKSVWFVNSPYSAELAAKNLRNMIDSNDSLIVIDATNNDAFWYNLTDNVGSHIQECWSA